MAEKPKVTIIRRALATPSPLIVTETATGSGSAAAGETIPKVLKPVIIRRTAPVGSGPSPVVLLPSSPRPGRPEDHVEAKATPKPTAPLVTVKTPPALSPNVCLEWLQTVPKGPVISDPPDLVADFSWQESPPTSPVVMDYLSSHRQWPLLDLRTLIEEDVGGENVNEHLTDILEKLVEHAKAEMSQAPDTATKKKHSFRIRSFENAIEALRNHPEVIISGAQARQIKGIGKGIADRIDEILRTEGLAELGTIGPDYKRLIRELTRISGIGVITARKLIDKYDLKSIEDLVAKFNAGTIQVGKHQLTHHQFVGMKYLSDFETKIPRAEIQEVEKILRTALKNVDPALMGQICGSYRRGKRQSGDIDMIVTHPAYATHSTITENVTIISRIVAELQRVGLVIDTLSEGTFKFMGAIRLRPELPARRLDLEFSPFNEYPTGLLYFTGSGQFNKIFRAKALSRGYTVSEHGIFPFGPQYGTGTPTQSKGPAVAVCTEADVFAVLGFKYLTPSQREF